MAKNDKREQKPDENSIDQETQSGTKAQVSRRRALIAGLAAAPAVLSLMNRSAWGGTQLSCATVASYVNAGGWSSPTSIARPTPDQGDRSRCGF